MSEFENQNETVENVTESAEEVSSEAYSAVAPEEKESNVFAIISMIAGILSILCCCFGAIGIVIAIAAVVLGIISIKKEEPKKGMAIAGIVCGGVGLILAVVAIAGSTAFLESYMEWLPEDVRNQIGY